MPNKQKKIFIITSYPKSLINFRGHLLREFTKAGYKVIACATGKHNETQFKLNSMGISYHPIPLKRQGLNLIQDIRTIFHLIKLFQSQKPEIVIGYTIKAVIYGSLAASLTGVNNIYSIITGRGYTLYNKTIKQKIIGKIVRFLYWLVLKYNKKVFFQNPDDMAFFFENSLLTKRNTAVLVHGSGVDLDYYYYSKTYLLPITFLLIARLLGEKGIIEYCKAAKILKMKYPDTKYQLIGWLDDNPSAIDKSLLDIWKQEGFIEYLGYKKDVRPYINKSSVYVLPSYWEGTPRTNLEAMSMGRPIITTNAPGCRETVEHGRNGFLVPVRDSVALKKMMEKFIINPSLLNKMGKESRKIAEEKYDVHKVNKVIIKEMNI